MKIVSVTTHPFRSVNSPQTVVLDEEVTALVGMNEAGKTVFLKALEKSRDAMGLEKFDPVEDFPRKDLSTYLKTHKQKPADAVTITYELSSDEIAAVNKERGLSLAPGFQFSLTHRYDNVVSMANLNVDDRSAIESLAKTAGLSTDAATAIAGAKTLKSIPGILKKLSLTDEDEAFIKTVEARISNVKWDSVVMWETWKWLEPRLPKFLYFGEYELLPSKMNLTDLAARVEKAKTTLSALKSEHRAVLALLRMADISIEDFTDSDGYETLKAKIESVSIHLTDQIMAFWKQNEELEVEIDIKQDSTDDAPFDSGPNLYLRIRNRRHRGVSTPFRQRSRGFIWFFSFLVWFDSVQHQIGGDAPLKENSLVLLLDEPGLNLHALAQADFLRYIDMLSEKHQVIYTTHSPFMIHSDRLGQVRIVEDKRGVGTIISDNISGSDPRTIFPLQAALGWTIAQNLFISARNLLVEGTSDMIYLDAVSALLNDQGQEGLREDVMVVPTGGLDKVATFIALLGANDLQIAVLHDYRGATEQRLLDLMKEKMISSKAVLNVSQFRNTATFGTSGKQSDIEDLFEPSEYLEYFNRAFSKQLKGIAVKETDLPPGDRIIDRIERFLVEKQIQLRPSGRFNHHAVAVCFSSNPPASLAPDTLKRFAEVFQTVNGIFTVDEKAARKAKVAPVMREVIQELSPTASTQ